MNIFVNLSSWSRSSSREYIIITKPSTYLDLIKKVLYLFIENRYLQYIPILVVLHTNWLIIWVHLIIFRKKVFRHHISWKHYVDSSVFLSYGMVGHSYWWCLQHSSRGMQQIPEQYWWIEGIHPKVEQSWTKNCCQFLFEIQLFLGAYLIHNYYSHIKLLGCIPKIVQLMIWIYF